MKKYYKIGEISRLYNIGVDSLRYYEEIGVIKPERSESGYRLYSLNDIWRLNVIRDLRELGFSMVQIKEYLDLHNVSTTLELLQQEEEKIQEKLKNLKRLKANIEKRRKNIEIANSRPIEKIMLLEYSERKCFSITEGYSDEHEMDVLIKRLLNIDKEHFYVIGNNQIGTVVSRKSVEENDVLKYVSVFIIDEKGKDVLKGGKYLSVLYKGEYNQSEKWTNELLKYVREHNLKPVGDFLEILWVDIHTSSDINEHITELQLLVEE